MSRINTAWSACYFITVYDLITELFTRRLSGREFAFGLITISGGTIFVISIYASFVPLIMAAGYVGLLARTEAGVVLRRKKIDIHENI